MCSLDQLYAPSYSETKCFAFDRGPENELWAEYFGNLRAPYEDPFEPVNDMVYPIVNKLDQIGKDASDDPTSHEIVGLLATSFYWRDMISGNLPSDSNGIVVVLSNPCNDPFTYQINGPNVTYLGAGDWHDSQYDSIAKHENFTSLRTFSQHGITYSGAPMNTDHCPITLHMYPSDTMKADFISHRPIVYTFGAVAIFVLTSLVFLVYDCFVERRQRVVLTTARRSSAIVSSLFPSQVRDRLYPMYNDSNGTAGGRLLSFLRDKGSTSNSEGDYHKLAGTPIAELYPETTVFFADISGFTAWSSIRQPTQVFHLLETLYGAFDNIAKSRAVFKVETIGDSYVAVVGLPTPRKNHAIVMARFARDCLDRMRVLTLELETALGPVSVLVDMATKA
jgi:Adenylate and Guanylate cyclase catalytic domain